MRYKHLKPWTGLGKAFYIFTWANFIGAAAGWFVADQLLHLFPALPWQPVDAVCIGAGLAATWPHQGRPLYQLGVIWLGYWVRRRFTPASLEIWSRDYYRRPAPKTGPVVISGQQIRTGQRRSPLAGRPPTPALPAPAPAGLAGTVPVRVHPVAATNGAYPVERAS